MCNCALSYHIIKIGQTVAEIQRLTFFKMATACHFGFVGHILEPTTKVIWWCYHYAKFGGIAAVALIIRKFEYFAHLAGKCLFTSFWGVSVVKMGDNEHSAFLSLYRMQYPKIDII